MAISLIVGFLLTPYIIERLGTAKYGIWMLIGSLISYYGLLDLGVSSAVVRYVARYSGRKEYGNLNEVISTALIMFSLFGLITVFLSFLLARPLATFFQIGPDDYISFVLVIKLLGFTTAVLFPSNVLSAILIAHERFVLSNCIRVLETIIRGCLCFAVLFNGGELVGISLVSAGLSVCVIFTRWMVVRFSFAHVHFSLRSARISVAPVLLSFGFFTTIRVGGGLLRTNMDAAVIGYFINPEVVGIYSVAALLIRYLTSAVVSIGGVTQPKLARIAGDEQKSQFRNYFLKYSVIVAYTAAGFGLVAFILGDDFFKLWLPDNFSNIDSAIVVLFILLIGQIPHLMANVSANALEAVNKHRYYAYQTIIEGVANLILSIILVRKIGIIGVALGTTIPILITKLIVQPIYCCKILSVKWSKYMVDVLLKPLFMMSSLVFLFNTTGLLLSTTSYLKLIVNAVVILLSYVILCYFFCFDGSTRQIIFTRFRDVLHGIRRFLWKDKGFVE